METLKNGRLILQPLTVYDAEQYHKLYLDDSGSEPARDFTERIISACNHVWTIRLPELPEMIIGDCALHHYNSTELSVEIGGSLFPDYQRKGLMKQAFKMVIAFAAERMPIKTIYGKTKPGNVAAIKLVLSLGFTVLKENDEETVLWKTL